MVLITMAQCNETWIFFIEHVSIWCTCVIVLTLTRGITNSGKHQKQSRTSQIHSSSIIL